MCPVLKFEETQLLSSTSSHTTPTPPLHFPIAQACVFQKSMHNFLHMIRSKNQHKAMRQGVFWGTCHSLPSAQKSVRKRRKTVRFDCRMILRALDEDCWALQAQAHSAEQQLWIVHPASSTDSEEKGWNLQLHPLLCILRHFEINVKLPYHRMQPSPTLRDGSWSATICKSSEHGREGFCMEWGTQAEKHWDREVIKVQKLPRQKI